MIIAIIIGAVSAFISLVSAGTSIGTIAYFRKKSSSHDEEDTNVTFNKKTIKELFQKKDCHNKHKQKLDSEDNDNSCETSAKHLLSRITEEEQIHIHDIDKHSVFSDTIMTRTGLPNETAKILAQGASGGLKSISVLQNLGGNAQETFLGNVIEGVSNALPKKIIDLQNNNKQVGNKSVNSDLNSRQGSTVEVKKNIENLSDKLHNKIMNFQELVLDTIDEANNFITAEQLTAGDIVE